MRNADDYAFIGVPGKELVLVRGVPGTGKSTLARSMASYSEGPVHLESDMYFSRYGKYAFNIEELGRAHRWCLTTAEVLLQTRGHVVVSNTFTRYKEMYDYVEFAANFKFSLRVVSLTKEYGNLHDVPELTLIAMRERFESHETILERIRADFPR